MAHHPHILMITFPAQGHINPTLQFAKKLVNMGVEITFSTSLSARGRMPNDVEPTKGFSTAFYSDGYDDGFKPTDDATKYMSAIRNCGSKNLKEIIVSSEEKGRPISCVVYSLLLPWAAQVAREMHVPSALLWIQPAAVLDIYYYYFTGHGEDMSNCANDPSWSIQLRGLPLLRSPDLPSFILPTTNQSYILIVDLLREQIETLNADANPMVLVNTFDALETEALNVIEKFKLIAIGPVLPSAFLEGKYRSDNTSRDGLIKKSNDLYIDWLDSKPPQSVVYVSFGSISVLPKHQMEEIGKGLLASGMSFLWVIRKKDAEPEEEKLSFIDELGGQGMIVPWCNQLEVLSHPALGCFLTHCGWNSTLESLVCGVPVVAFPQWSDQTTNAKLVVDVWKTGVRVRGNEEGVVDGEEVHKCLEMVMQSEEMRTNAQKWGDLAREATCEGGSSDTNLKAFVDEIVIVK